MGAISPGSQWFLEWLYTKGASFAPRNRPALTAQQLHPVGPDLVQLMGRDWTGEPVDSYEPPEFRDQLIGVCRDVVHNRQPVANTRRLVVDDRYLRYGGIILPLSRDGSAIDALLIGIAPLGDWGFAAAKRR